MLASAWLAVALPLVAAATPLPVRSEPRVWSNGPTTWIYPARARSRQPSGSLRAGFSLRVRETEPTRAAGCRSKGWIAVQPDGFVCLDENAAFEATPRYARAMQLAAPSNDVFPFNYAISDGAPMYSRLPSPNEWRAAERTFGAAGARASAPPWQRGHEALASEKKIVARESPPWFLRDGGSASSHSPKSLVRRTLPAGSMLAYTRAFLHAGRSWLLSSDGTVVPADRVRPFRRSSFAGVRAVAEGALPLAWTRRRTAAAFQREADGSFRAAGKAWAVRTPIPLRASAQAPSVSVWFRGELYLETRQRQGDQPLWVKAETVSVAENVSRLPAGIGADEKWLWFSISRGILVAYRGLQPVYVTLASPGIGGVPKPDSDLVRASMTPLGRFRITYKHRARDMSPEQGDRRKFWIAEVPDTQYFKPPFALHTAYWHENFGEPMSGGCINLSPLDGRWLFGFTAPALPAGFNGVGTGGVHGLGTVVVVVR